MTAGEAVGFAVPAAVGALAFGLGLPDAATVPLAAAAGAGEGAILGLAQAHVLREEVAGFGRRAWVAGTAAAAALCWAIGMSLGVYGGALPTAILVPCLVGGGAVLLTAVGVAQWLVLRRYVRGAGAWIPANTAGWVLGLPVPFLALSLVDEGDPAGYLLAAGIASGLVMGLVVAAITGLALVRLLGPRWESR
jgi:hypothetical protein